MLNTFIKTFPSLPSNTAPNPQALIPELDYTLAILSKERSLYKSIIPAIMYTVEQYFEPSSEFETKITKLFADSFYIVAFLEKEIQTDAITFNEDSLIASNLQHSLTCWYFFSKLFEQYRQTEHYQTSDAQTKTKQLFDYFQGSLLLSLKYNSDEDYWTKDFASFNRWAFQDHDTQESTLQQTFKNLQNLIMAFPFVTAHLPWEYKHSIQICKDVAKLHCFFKQWENLHSFIKFQLIEDIQQKCDFIQDSIDILIEEDQINQKSIMEFIQNLSTLYAQVKKATTPTSLEQRNLKQIEHTCLAGMDWKLAALDICSDAEKYKLILAIEKKALDYINTQLAYRQDASSPSYLPMQEAQMVPIESSEELSDDSMEDTPHIRHRSCTV